MEMFFRISPRLAAEHPTQSASGDRPKRLGNTQNVDDAWDSALFHASPTLYFLVLISLLSGQRQTPQAIAVQIAAMRIGDQQGIEPGELQNV